MLLADKSKYVSDVRPPSELEMLPDRERLDKLKEVTVPEELQVT